MPTKTDKKATPINDFDVLDFETKHVAEEGTFMPFRHPDTGEPMVHQTEDDKEPRALGLQMKGAESADAQRVFRQFAAREKRRGDFYEPSNDDVQSDRVSDSKAVAKLVTGGLLFSGGQWVEIDQGNAADYLYKVDPLRKQALKYVLHEGNHLVKSRG